MGAGWGRGEGGSRSGMHGGLPFPVHVRLGRAFNAMHYIAAGRAQTRLSLYCGGIAALTRPPPPTPTPNHTLLLAHAGPGNARPHASCGACTPHTPLIGVRDGFPPVHLDHHVPPPVRQRCLELVTSILRPGMAAAHLQQQEQQLHLLLAITTTHVLEWSTSALRTPRGVLTGPCKPGAYCSSSAFQPSRI